MPIKRLKIQSLQRKKEREAIVRVKLSTNSSEKLITYRANRDRKRDYSKNQT